MSKFSRSRSFLPVVTLLLSTLASPAFAGGHGHAQHENTHRFTPSAGLNSNTSRWLNGIGRDEKNDFFVGNGQTSTRRDGNGKIQTSTGGPFENVILEETATGGSLSTPRTHNGKIQTGTGGPFENATSATGTGGALKNLGFSFFKHRRAWKS